jgi:hypothetical protein
MSAVASSRLTRMTAPRGDVLLLLTVLVGLLRAPLAVPSDDTEVHRFLPLALCLSGLVMAATARRGRPDASR